MKNQVFLDEINDDLGKRAFELALSSLQEALPQGSYVSGCVHCLDSGTVAHLQVHIDGESYELHWRGKHISQLGHFIEGNLAPILRTWNRSFSEFFQNLHLSREEGVPVCQGKNCYSHQQSAEATAAKG